MARSVKKGPFVDERLTEKIKKAKEKGDRKPIKTWNRQSTITPEFIGLTLLVHNGKRFFSIYVSENMVGHKLGEFVPTRTFKAHGAHTERSVTAT